MPPIKINTYDFNLDVTENLKANFLADRVAKNRWGKKFSRLYKRHDSDLVIDGVDVVGTYDFTAGMRASVSSLSGYEADLLAAQNFRTKMLNDLQVETDGVWSLEGALASSYMSVLIERVEDKFLRPMVEVRGLHFSLSLEADSGDGRKVSWFHSSGVDEDTVCMLEPLEEEDATYGLHLVSSDGVAYGHYDGGLREGTLHDNVLGLYGVEDTADVHFHADQNDRFADIWPELLVFAKLMVNDKAPETIGERVSVVVGLGQLLDWVDKRIVILEEAIDDLENNEERVGEDLDLIEHLDIGETLYEEIVDPGEIKYIWFKFEKMISPSMVYDPDTEAMVADQTYVWWEEEQFDEIREQVKNFQDYCTVEWREDSLYRYTSKVYVKKEMLDIAGHKIYWFVAAFLDIEVKVKDPSFFEQLLNFILLIIAIVLTIVSENPMWLKMVLVTTSVLGYMGVLSPEIMLAVAILSFGYGVYSVDFSSLNTMQMFQWAIKNINMIFKMVGMYDAIGIKKEMEAEAKEASEGKSSAELQDEAMTFLYTRAYSQYDEMYELLYDFEPKYRF